MGLFQRLLALFGGGQAPSVSGSPALRPEEASRAVSLSEEEAPRERAPTLAGASTLVVYTPVVHTLVVGIGNPGAEYEATRHNAGFLAVERLAGRLGVELPDADPPRTRLAEGAWDGRGVALAQPQAYMNRSGPPLAALLEHYGLGADRVLLVYDDLSIPPGTIRLRGKGSAGGHNGVQSVIDALGSSEFPRLRIGIGDRFERGGLVDYVLAPFPDDELDALDTALDLAAEAALAFAADGLNVAMNLYNRRSG